MHDPPPKKGLPQHIRPSWQRVAARLQSVAHTDGHAIVTLRVVVNADGNPVVWASPTVTKLEPKPKGACDAVAGKGQISVEVCFRTAVVGEPDMLMSKTNVYSSEGWSLYVHSNGAVRATINCATTSRIAGSTTTVNDDEWHTALFTYDETGDRFIRLWIDGVLEATSAATAGNYIPDNARNCVAGAESDGGRPGPITFGWLRVRDDIVQTDNYVPNHHKTISLPSSEVETVMDMPDATGPQKQAKNQAYKALLVTYRNYQPVPLPQPSTSDWSPSGLGDYMTAYAAWLAEFTSINAVAATEAGRVDDYITVTLGQVYPLPFNL